MKYLKKRNFTSEKPISTRLATAASHSGSGVGPKWNAKMNHSL